MDYPWNAIYKITIYKLKDEKDDSSLRISTIKTDEGFETAFYEQEEEQLKVEVPGLDVAAGKLRLYLENDEGEIVSTLRRLVKEI